MKRIVLSILLIGTLSLWSVAQRPQTTVGRTRPSTTVKITRPQTTVSNNRPVTTVEVARPTTAASGMRPQTVVNVVRPQTAVVVNHPATTVEVVHPATTVEVLHPQTTVEVLHPQTPGYDEAAPRALAGTGGAKVGGKAGAVPSAQASTSMSNFQPKQAKDFAALTKAAPAGGGENKLGNATNSAEKDAANKASLLGKQSNQNLEVAPKATNLSGLQKAVEQKVNNKK